MEFNLHLSKNEQSLLLEKVDDVDYLVSLCTLIFAGLFSLRHPALFN
jgi:hypothetical protein